MSRNFELLERVENTQVLTPLGMPTPIRAPFSSLVRKEGVPREEIIRLVQRLFFEHGHAGGPALVSFCGMASDDRSSWVCARAAEYLASKVDASVCLVDADFHSPQLHSHFALANQAGFAAALTGKAPLRQFVASVSSTNLWLIPAGSIQPGTRATKENLSLRYAELRQEFDYVFVSGPPLSQKARAMQLAKLADGIVLIAESGWISRQLLRRTSKHLKKAGIAILGAVRDPRKFSFPKYLHQRLRLLSFPKLPKRRKRHR